MNCAVVLLAELKPDTLTAIAYNSPEENSIFYDKDLSNSISKYILDNNKPYFIDNLQDSDYKESLESNANFKCFYGIPINTDQGEVFAALCMYSKELSYISEEKISHLENIKIQIDEDILYAEKERQQHTMPRDVLFNEDQKLKYFFSFSPIGIFYFDKNLVITDLNDRFAEILKSSNEVLLGLNINKIHDKRVLPTLQSALLGVEDEYEGEYNTSTSKSCVHILLKVSPVFVNQKVAGGIGILQDISLRTNIAKALKSSENKYRELVEKINDVIFSLDSNGICTYVSPVIKLLIGYGPDEVIGYHFINFIHANHKITFHDALRKVALGTTIVSEVKIRNKNGLFHWIRSSMRPIYGEEGTLIGIHGIAQDIEETRLAEISLRESEEQFRTLATHISDIIYEWNPNTDELTWHGNPSVISSKLSNINKFTDLYEEMHPDDRNKINLLWQNARENHKAWKEEFRIKNEDSQIHILGSGLILFRDDKPFKGFGTLTNISKEKGLVQNLKLSNEQLEDNIAKINGLMSAIPDMMFVFNKSGYITDYHSNDEQQLYEKVNSFLHKNVLDVLPKNIALLTLEKTVKALQSKKIETYKYELTIDDSLQTFESRMISLNDEHSMAIVRNITTNEIAEKELIAAKEKAEESDRLKSSFLANMSHEIRTPMNGIIGFSELLSSKTLNPSEREYYTSVIIKSGHQLLEIINDVLEISKIETGQIIVNNSSININETLELLFLLFNKKALDKHNEFIVHKILDDSDAYAYTDSGKLKQVLNNLLSNAIKFTSNGTISFGYSIIEDKFIEFYVEDDGIGIAKMEQQKIFERFTQANPKIMRQHGGTGLGLSISKSLVEILDGKIWVESEPDNGAKFSFTLPYNKVE